MFDQLGRCARESVKRYWIIESLNLDKFGTSK